VTIRTLAAGATGQNSGAGDDAGAGLILLTDFPMGGTITRGPSIPDRGSI
jgi:hypothetical protein